MLTGIVGRKPLGSGFSLALLRITGANVYFFDVFGLHAGVQNNLQFQEKWYVTPCNPREVNLAKYARLQLVIVMWLPSS
jgi:hypothetical protein